MISTQKQQLDIEQAGEVANQYISSIFGNTYFTYGGEQRDDCFHFMVKCLRDDMKRDPAVGAITVFASGDIQTLSDERIRDMKETAETQAAQQRQSLARDADGVVLRYHARILASSWLADSVDHKLSAAGGLFVPSLSSLDEVPIWRFSIQDVVIKSAVYPLGILDVNALSGEVLKPNDEEIEIIVRGMCASRKRQKYTAAI